MKKNKKLCLSFILCAAMLLGGIQSAYASGDWTPGRDYEWSPYVTSSTATTYTSSLRAYIEFFFDKTGADANNNALYFTMEENCGDGVPLVGDLQFSNIPDPHFDYDDDDGDGYEEESEVVVGLFGVLDSSTYYYFTTWWDKDGSVPAGTVNFIAQRSAWNPLNGEYEALYYDLLESESYSAMTAASALATLSQETNALERVKLVRKDTSFKDKGKYLEESVISNNKMEVTVKPKIETLRDVFAYKEMQHSNIKNIRYLTAKTAQDKFAQGTVTFKNPISINTLNSILKESNAKLKDGEIKFINEKGEWITVNARNINQNTIERVTNEIIESGLAKKLTCEGITSVRVLIDLYDDSYETMSANDNVFLVDMMDEIVKHEYDDFEGKIKVRVFDLAWVLKDLK